MDNPSVEARAYYLDGRDELLKQGYLEGFEAAKGVYQEKLDKQMSFFTENTLPKIQRELVATFGDCIKVVSKEPFKTHCLINGSKEYIRVIRAYPTCEMVISRIEIGETLAEWELE